MNKTGNAPPMTIKSPFPDNFIPQNTETGLLDKGKWIAKERLRWAHQFHIPMATDMPPEFPVNTLLVMRALTAINQLYPDHLETILAAIYEKSFVDRRAVHTLEAVKSILDSFLGMPAAEGVLSKAATSEFKQRLVQDTDEAIDSGAFGLPWFKATNPRGEEECFWGFDHLGQVCDHLGLEKPHQDTRSDSGWRTML